MSLQWLPLQQRQKAQSRGVVSEALTPQRTTAGAPVGGAGIMGGVSGAKGFAEKTEEKHALEAKRKYEEKMMKLQHEQEMEKMQFAAGMEEDARKFATPITAGEALGRAPTEVTAPALTKENMPEAAKTMWDFILSLDEAGQKFFIQQLKEKELGTAGYIEAAGKRIELPGSVGMYGHLVDQGLIDPATDTVIKREPEVMKDKFDIKEGYIFDTTTGERKKLSVDEPKKALAEINAEANAYGQKMAATGEISFENAKYDYFIDNEVDPSIAKGMSKITTIPQDPGKIPWYTKAINWLTGEKKLPKGWAPKGAGVPGRGAFNEANVTSLVPVISDDVTEAERAHLKSQGATDSDIDEAIRRKAGE